MDFLERLSVIVCYKQTLFKQKKDIYYTKHHGCDLEKEEAEERLLDYINNKTYNPIGRKNKFGNLFN